MAISVQILSPCVCSPGMPELGVPGVPLATIIFGRSVNPIPTKEADFAHPLLLAPPFFFTFQHPKHPCKSAGQFFPKPKLFCFV